MTRLLSLIIFASCCFLNSNAGVQTVVNTNNSGVGSLRGAISIAVNGDTIRFDNNLIAGGTDSIILDSAIEFSKNLTIIGLINGSDSLIISGGGTNRIFTITSVNKVVIDSLVIKNGSAIDGGGILFEDSDSLFIFNSIVCNNNATQFGGGVYSSNYDTTNSSFPSTYSVVIVDNSLISHNTARGGAGLFSESFNDSSSSIIKISNSIISHNSSINSGGGIYSNSFSDSSYTSFSSVEIINSDIIYNSASSGGGIYSKSISRDSIAISNVLIDNSNINYNTATSCSGGGIYCEGETNRYGDSIFVKIINSDISNNTSPGGGGISVFSSSSGLSSFCLFELLNSTIKNNTSGGLGISARTSKVVINNSTIDSNSAINGGGMLIAGTFSNFYAPSVLRILNSTVSNNFATNNGGGAFLIFIDSVFVTNSTIAKNNARSGGAFFNQQITAMDITNSTISNNNATFSGGAAFVPRFSPILSVKGSVIFNPSGTNPDFDISNLYIRLLA